jgi:hypothetical protein
MMPMPILSFTSLAPSPATRRHVPEAPPSWRVGRRVGPIGRARAGLIKALPALLLQLREWLPERELQQGMAALAREVMLGGVIGIGGGWAAAWLAIRLGL